MSKAVEVFCRLVEALTYKGKATTLIPLTNITFFLGAGFAKSWDRNYPLGTELFQFSEIGFKKSFEALGSYIQQCGFDPYRVIDFDMFSECCYKLGMLKKYPEIRSRYIDEQTISIVDAELKALVWQALNERVTINYADSNALNHKHTDENQKEILAFFESLFDQSDGSGPAPQGIRVHFITTNYDFLIEGILDEYYHPPDDFHYIHTYRGFTPKLINGERNIQPVHDHWLVSNVLKINGGLEIRYDVPVFNIDHRPKTIDDVIQNPPEIILPSKEQDYTSLYFKSIFSKVTRLLQESRILVVVGYSFPKEDALLRFILRHFAEHERDMINKQLFYIDIGNNEELMKKINSICPSAYAGNKNVHISNRGFIHFVKSVNKIGMP